MLFLIINLTTIIFDRLQLHRAVNILLPDLAIYSNVSNVSYWFTFDLEDGFFRKPERSYDDPYKVAGKSTLEISTYLSAATCIAPVLGYAAKLLSEIIL